MRKLLRTGGELSLQWSNNRYLNNPNAINLLVPRYTSALDLSLNQPLLRGFGWRYAYLMVKVAQNTEQVTYEQYASNLSDIVLQVEQSYWQLVQAISNVSVQERGLAFGNEVLRQNQGKFKVGTLPRTAVLEAQSDVARREADLIAARNQRDIARANLRSLINYRSAEAAALAMIDPVDQPTVEPYPMDIQRSLKLALDDRPELVAARLQIRGNGSQRKIAENAVAAAGQFRWSDRRQRVEWPTRPSE